MMRRVVWFCETVRMSRFKCHRMYRVQVSKADVSYSTKPTLILLLNKNLIGYKSGNMYFSESAADSLNLMRARQTQIVLNKPTTGTS